LFSENFHHSTRYEKLFRSPETTTSKAFAPKEYAGLQKRCKKKHVGRPATSKALAEICMMDFKSVEQN